MSCLDLQSFTFLCSCIVSIPFWDITDNHSKEFETPKGIPPIRDHDHAIHLIQDVFLQTSCLIDILMFKRAKLNV